MLSHLFKSATYDDVLATVSSGYNNSVL